MPYQRWNNVKKLCATFKSDCFDVVQSWFNVISMLDADVGSMLCNIENPTLDFVPFPTSDQCYFNCDPQCWNVGWVVYMKKLILRNILPAALLTNWNFQEFFKDYAKTFTTPVSTNSFSGRLLRIRLRLVVSNSRDLQQVPN